jgi:all-trans-retinol 13,14-reductase
MSQKIWERRDFIKSLLAGLGMVAFDWGSLPKAAGVELGEDEFDAVIIGSGLGGLSCAAAFARQDFKPLVLEQHCKPGGYATTFKRPGGFIFDVSLHSTSVGNRNGKYNLLPGFPEITDVEFVPHPNLHRVMTAEYDFRVPQKDLPGFIKILTGYFPDEKKGIEALFEDMKGVARDINKIIAARGKIDMQKFPIEYPYLFSAYSKTWGQMVDVRITNPKLKELVSFLWGYYGLPPSKLAGFYYAFPTIDFLSDGGYYPIGRSQKISNSLVEFITSRGGKVMLKTRAEEILVNGQTAYGIKTADGKEYKGKVIISNANAYGTFHKMLKADEYLRDYLTRMDNYSVSLSIYQVFLGLKNDLVGKLGIPDTEISIISGPNSDEEFGAALNADVENCGFGLMLYDNLYEGYSPPGKNIIHITALQGYDYWEKYEADYFAENKKAYRKEKERMAQILIKRAEEKLLPGLAEAIEVMEVGTPLTNLRYTGNYRGAIYGWDQTLDNSGPSRMPHVTPVENLYLAGAWTSPGGGYGGVIWSGLECFGEIMKRW